MSTLSLTDSDACSPLLSRSVRASLLLDVVLAPIGLLPILKRSELDSAKDLAARVVVHAPVIGANDDEPEPLSSYRAILTDLLPMLAPDYDIDPSLCPLLPDRDATLAMDEASFPYGPGTHQQRGFSPRRSHLLLYSAASKDLPSSNSGRVSSGSGWACLLCGKRFKTQFYLDRHLQRRHSDVTNAKISDKKKDVCLADYCEAVGCADSRSHGRGSYDGRYGPGDGKALAEPAFSGVACDDEAMRDARHECEGLLEGCFGRVEEWENGALEGLKKDFCARLTCASKLHGLAGKAAMTGYTKKEIWDENSVYRLGWGKLLLVLVLVFYVGVVVVGGGRGRGRELSRRKGLFEKVDEIRQKAFGGGKRGGGVKGGGEGRIGGAKSKQF